MTGEITVGTFDNFGDALRAVIDGDKPGHSYSCTMTEPYVVTEQRMSDAEMRYWDAERIAHSACQAFGARFQHMSRRVRFRAEAMAKIAASTSLCQRSGDHDRAFRKARRAAVRVVNHRGTKHV